MEVVDDPCPLPTIRGLVLPTAVGRRKHVDVQGHHLTTVTAHRLLVHNSITPHDVEVIPSSSRQLCVHVFWPQFMYDPFQNPEPVGNDEIARDMLANNNTLETE